MDIMDPTIRGIFYLVALIIFVVAAIESRIGPRGTVINLTALGLAVAVFPLMWDNFAAG